MIFDIYYPFIKDGKLVPGVKPTPMEWADIVTREASNPQVKERLAEIRAEQDAERQAELKKSLVLNPTDAQLIAADPSQGFNVLGLLKALLKKRKESKKERFRRMLEEY